MNPLGLILAGVFALVFFALAGYLFMYDRKSKQGPQAIFWLGVAGLCLLMWVGWELSVDANRARIFGYGAPHMIEMYSGGQLVRTFYATGKVVSEAASDGYRFMDKDTGQLREVSGHLVITQLTAGE